MEEQQGCLRGLYLAKGILLHAKDKEKALESLLNAIDQQVLLGDFTPYEKWFMGLSSEKQEYIYGTDGVEEE